MEISGGGGAAGWHQFWPMGSGTQAQGASTLCREMRGLPREGGKGGGRRVPVPLVGGEPL